MSALKLAPGISLPLDVVTQTIGILAQKRKGKSYTARRLVEQLFKAGQQIVIVDPKGDWWGVRSSADGKKPGLSIVIVGGERGDVPLESSGGEVVAKLVVEERVSVLLDLSLLRKHEIATFMTSFLENLYRLKAREANRTPMMLVIDEADAVAPQKPRPNEARMLGAAEDIVRRGGQRGIGCTLITQRSAVLNKNVLSQIQLLVTLCTIAPQDLAALNDWIDVHGNTEQRGKLMASLPSLPRGDAWWWSPGWPTDNGIFARAHTYEIETFDSGATPKPGEKRVDPKSVADVDLNVLRRQMASTIERAKADDPKMLKKRIAELESALEKKPTKVEQVDKLVFSKGELVEFKRCVDGFSKRCEEMSHGLQHVVAIIKESTERVGRAESAKHDRTDRVLNGVMALAPPPLMNTRLALGLDKSERSETNGVTRPQQRIIDALLSFEKTGFTSGLRANLAVMADQSPRSSGYTNNLSSLRSAGLISYPSSSAVALTDAGRAVAVGEKLDLRGLRAAWQSKLPAPQWRILAVLIEEYPNELARTDAAEMSGQSPTSSGYTNNLSALRSLGLLDYPSRGTLVATDLICPRGLA